MRTWVNLSRFLGSRLRCTSAISFPRHVVKCGLLQTRRRRAAGVRQDAQEGAQAAATTSSAAMHLDLGSVYACGSCNSDKKTQPAWISSASDTCWRAVRR